MKKFIACALLVLMCCAPLCACSLDFSAQIDETMDGLYDTLYNALELFFKKTGVEDDSDKDEGITDGEQPSTPDNGENGDNNTSGGNNNQTAPDDGSNTANDDNQSINTDDSIIDNDSGLENSQESEDTKNEK